MRSFRFGCRVVFLRDFQQFLLLSLLFDHNVLYLCFYCLHSLDELGEHSLGLLHKLLQRFFVFDGYLLILHFAFLVALFELETFRGLGLGGCFRAH